MSSSVDAAALRFSDFGDAAADRTEERARPAGRHPSLDDGERLGLDIGAARAGEQITRETLDAERSSRRFAREEARADLYRKAQRIARREVALDFLWAISWVSLLAVAVFAAVRIGGPAIALADPISLAWLAETARPLAAFVAPPLAFALTGLALAGALSGGGVLGFRGARRARSEFQDEVRLFCDQTRSQGRMLSNAVKARLDGGAGHDEVRAGRDQESLSLLWLAYKDYYDVSESLRQQLAPAHADRRPAPELTFALGAFAFGLFLGVVGAASFFGGPAPAPQSVLAPLAGVFAGLMALHALFAVGKSAYNDALRRLEDIYKSQFTSVQLEGPRRMSRRIAEAYGPTDKAGRD